MKQGKGLLLTGARCKECGEPIDQIRTMNYWSWETTHDRYGDSDYRTYYHRSCARKVGKRREDAYRKAGHS